MAISQPYWLHKPPSTGAYTVDDQQLLGLAENAASMPVKFDKKGDEARVTFHVTPPASESVAALTAEVELANGKKISRSLTTIDYPHIHPQRVFGESTAKTVRVNVKKRGSRIG